MKSEIEQEYKDYEFVDNSIRTAIKNDKEKCNFFQRLFYSPLDNYGRIKLSIVLEAEKIRNDADANNEVKEE